MRARVLFTNGHRTIDLFWLEHTGRDVYYGTPGRDSKTSNHASGRVHMKEAGNVLWDFQAEPLKELKGSAQLMSMTFDNLAWLFAEKSPFKTYSGRSADAVLTIDGRSIPDGQALNMSVALIEPGNLEAMGRMMADFQGDEFWVKTQQVLIATSVEPWVLVRLSWQSN